MEVKDNKNDLPIQHYGELFAAMDPVSVSSRTGIPYADGTFTTKLLNRPVRVTWPEMEASFADTGALLRPNAKILLARVLTGGTLTEDNGKRISYAELPWGETYLTQFRGRCISRLAFGFANTPEKFASACESIGGKEYPGNTPAYEIEFLPGLIVRLIVWPAEDDIPPSAQFLFSGNFPLAFSAEDVAYVGDVIIDAMKGKF